MYSFLLRLRDADVPPIHHLSNIRYRYNPTGFRPCHRVIRVGPSTPPARTPCILRRQTHPPLGIHFARCRSIHPLSTQERNGISIRLVVACHILDVFLSLLASRDVAQGNGKGDYRRVGWTGFSEPLHRARRRPAVRTAERTTRPRRTRSPHQTRTYTRAVLYMQRRRQMVRCIPRPYCARARIIRKHRGPMGDPTISCQSVGSCNSES